MRLVFRVVCACLALSLSPAAFGQQAVDYGSIGGQVTDPSGGVVQGAHVSARHGGTNVTTTTATDRDYWRPWKWLRRHARRGGAAWPGGGEMFSIAARGPPAGVGGPSKSVG